MGARKGMILRYLYKYGPVDCGTIVLSLQGTNSFIWDVKYCTDNQVKLKEYSGEQKKPAA